jgi:hypothetical protein
VAPPSSPRKRKVKAAGQRQRSSSDDKVRKWLNDNRLYGALFAGVLAMLGVGSTWFYAYRSAGREEEQARRETEAAEREREVETDQLAAPLTVSVSQLSECGASWFVEASVQDTFDNDPPINDLLSTSPYASPHDVLVTIQGKTDAEVTLTGMKVNVERRPAPSGTIVSPPCGGEGYFRSMLIDLDATPPSMRPRIDFGGSGGSEPGARREPLVFPYEVAIHDAETFEMVVYTAECDCQWTVDLSWSSQGKTGKTRVDNGGKPFHTVGGARAEADCTVLGDCDPYRSFEREFPEG